MFEIKDLIFGYFLGIVLIILFLWIVSDKEMELDSSCESVYDIRVM